MTDHDRDHTEVMTKLDRLDRKVDEVLKRQRHTERLEIFIMGALEDLEAAAKDETTVDDSVIALLKTLVDKVDAANTANDPRIAAVTASVRGNLDRLSAAVLANTPVAPPVPPPVV